MKTLIFGLATLILTVTAKSQTPGAIHFNNQSGNNGRVLLPDGTGVGVGWVAELYFVPVGTPLTRLVAIVPSTTFKTSTDAARGYVNPVDVIVPVFPGETAPRSSGEKVTVVMRVFNGRSFENSIEFGESTPITITLGGGFSPPAKLIGLKSFTVRANSVTSKLPIRFVPGESLRVSVYANPIPSIASYYVQDQIPSGWTIVQISDQGTFDPPSGLVHWGPFADNRARELQYEVRSNVDRFEAVRFEGEAVIDNVKYPITGDRQSQPGSRIVIKRLPNGEVHLQLHGSAAEKPSVWVSRNLSEWAPLGEMERTNSIWQFIDPGAVSEGIRFYRASE